MDEHAPFLRVAGVTKTFDAEGAAHAPIRVIDNVSMNLAAGEFAVYLGPSGCGKTTLMRIVGGLETATGGEIYLAGKKVVGPDRKKGMVFQAYTSFPWLTGPSTEKTSTPGKRTRSPATISTWWA